MFLPSPSPSTPMLPASSKRKSSGICYSTAFITPRLPTVLPSLSSFTPSTDEQQDSPRTDVVSQLQNLDLSETDFTPLDFGDQGTPKLLFGKGEEKELEMPETPKLKSVRLGGVMEGEKLWWSEADITGHDPQDPLDDGEGINGVGFLPTPAIAHAREERRKRQVKDWKEREARETRQRRSERRRRRKGEVEDADKIVRAQGTGVDSEGEFGNGSTSRFERGIAGGIGSVGGGMNKRRKVRFLQT